MKNNIGALAEPLKYSKSFYPKKFTPEGRLDTWLRDTPFFTIAEQLAMNGGLWPWEIGRVFRIKRTHASFSLSQTLDL